MRRRGKEPHANVSLPRPLGAVDGPCGGGSRGLRRSRGRRRVGARDHRFGVLPGDVRRRRSGRVPGVPGRDSRSSRPNRFDPRIAAYRGARSSSRGASPTWPWGSSPGRPRRHRAGPGPLRGDLGTLEIDADNVAIDGIDVVEAHTDRSHSGGPGIEIKRMSARWILIQDFRIERNGRIRARGIGVRGDPDRRMERGGLDRSGASTENGGRR